MSLAGFVEVSLVAIPSLIFLLLLAHLRKATKLWPAEKTGFALAYFAAEGTSVSLNVVISRANYSKISEIVHTAAENGAHFLRLSAFIPQGSGELHRALYGLDRRIVGEVRQQIADILPRAPIPIIEGAFRRPSPNAFGETFGCGAGTHSLTINPDLSLGACDLLSEHDRTRPLESPAQILETWRTDGLFQKWRGQTEDPQFKSVHQHGCHLALMRYGENIFA